MTNSYIEIDGVSLDVEAVTLPSEILFAEAWKMDSGSIVVDMPTAREIYRQELRKLRKPELEKLDVEWFRAAEQGGDTSSIAAAKQKLRDVTADARIEAASTTEELKALTLEVLIA